MPGKTLRLIRRGFEVAPDMSVSLTQAGANNLFHVLPGVVLFRNEAPRFVIGLGQQTLDVGKYVRLVVVATAGAYVSGALEVAAELGDYYTYSAGSDTETWNVPIAHRTKAGMTQYHLGAVRLDSPKRDDIYAAVNSSDVPDYLENQFAAMVKEGESGALTANGAVWFSVLDVAGDKKIVASVRLDAGNVYGLIVDTTTPTAPTLRIRRKNSVVLDGGELQLSGDEATPDALDIYGYQSDSKGWKALTALLAAIGNLATDPEYVLGKDGSTVGWVATAECDDSVIDGGTY